MLNVSSKKDLEGRTRRRGLRSRGAVKPFENLFEAIVQVISCVSHFTDIVIHEGAPIKLRLPGGFADFSGVLITRPQLERFFEVLEPDWRAKLRFHAFNSDLGLGGPRIRANVFTFGGLRRLGCVIRAFPAEPLPLAELGLRQCELDLCKPVDGLVLVAGNSGQGKSTTIASMVDQINMTRHGQIYTLEDKIETLIPSRKCRITQREVGEGGDVACYAFGASDATRCGADVVVIGEITAADRAIEALTLAENGALVLASINALSTDAALRRMLGFLRLRPDGAIAFSQVLRGLVFQHLVPSIRHDRYHLATESLTANPELARMLALGKISETRSLMDRRAGGIELHCHSMDDSLASLVRDRRISVRSAKRASTNPGSFAQVMLNALEQRSLSEGVASPAVGSKTSVRPVVY